MSSWDISFCDNKECKRKDCRRHYDKAQKAFSRGAIQLSFCSWLEDGCEAYWKEE